MTGRPLRVSACILIASCLMLASCERKSETSRREVVLYCSADQVFAQQVIRAFEQETGIRVRARFDTEASKTVGLVQRLRAEASEPAADVFWSSEVFHTIRLAEEGLLASYRSDRTADWPETFADPEGRWYGFARRARVIAYNTNKVKPADAPRSLEDVLDATWKDRVVMARPEFGTTGGDVASWFVHYGAERATEILRQLRAGGVRLVDGNSTAVRMVATGQADVCFTDTDDVYAAQRKDWPVAMHYLDQGGKGPLAIPNTAAVIRGAPHEAEARELMAFLLSNRVELMLAASDSHNAPVRATVPDELSAYAIPRSLDIDYAEVARQLPTAIRTATEILR
jgi:iron(III) transport system substrate-binding protein